LAARAGREFYGDLDVAAKEGLEVHEAFGEETGKLAAQEARNFRLIDFQDVGGAGLRETLGTDGLGDADCQIGLARRSSGLGQTDIRKDIATALLDFDSLAHA